MTNTTTTIKRVTKAQRYNDIKAILSGSAPSYGTDIATALAFIDNEIALLTKKNTAEKKEKAKNEADERNKALILDYLMTTPSATCTEINRAIPEFADFNNQKIAYFMRDLKDENRVVKNMVKGKAVFSLA